MDRNDDRYWIAGFIYFNRDDPAILVPKRAPWGLGAGRTMNMAHPVSWLLTFGPVLLVAFLVALSKR